MAPEKTGFAYALLRQVCRIDSEYTYNQINTLYFDTANLDQYMKSVSGEFRKDKVRIRWYGGTGKSQGMVPLFIELKSGWGFASSEQRCRVLVPAESLEKPRLASGIVDSVYW